MHLNSRFVVCLFGAALLPFILARPASASKEGGLSLYSVVVDSPGMGGSGPVHVEMKRSDEGIEKLMISAFGKNEMVPSQLLQSIKEKRWISGVQLSWEKGYQLLGGQKVYVSLTEGGVLGGIVVAKIGFSEDGKFRVSKNLSREEVRKLELENTNK